MASSETRSPFCSPQEDPFLLLESAQKAIEGILRGHAGRPLRRTWIEHPYGEEEICLLEEEVLPAIERCMARVEEIDQALQQEQEFQRHQGEVAQRWPGRVARGMGGWAEPGQGLPGGRQALQRCAIGNHDAVVCSSCSRAADVGTLRLVPVKP